MKKITILAGALALIVTSCGETKTEKPAAEKPVSMAEKAEAEKEVEASEIAVTIKANDQMKYDLSEIKVPANSTVTLTLVNEGQLAKEAMGHNFVILKQGVDMADFATRAVAAGMDKDYLPEGDETVAHTTLTGGGETVTITFDAPAKGSYDFLCSFPGHWGMMQGKFIVE